jgi:transcriptional adapter 1
MSTVTSLDLNVAKKNLADVLGDGMKVYLQMLKSWFKQKMSREDFDHEARNLLSADTVHLHNQFLLAILTKCQSLGSTILTGQDSTVIHSTQPVHFRQLKKLKSKGKPVIGPTGLYQKFLPVDALCQAPQIQSHFPEQDDRVPEFATHDLLLPDIAMVHGRLVVSAWEFGLEGVHDDAVKLLMHAVEAQLKTVLTTVVMTRKSYQVHDGCFRHGFGSHTPMFHIRNASLTVEADNYRHPTTITSHGSHVPNVRPNADLAERDAAVQLACAPIDSPLSSTYPPISLFDLLAAFQVHKSALPSHTVYTLNVERILNRMVHPSLEELEQDEIHRQESDLKHELRTQQLLLCPSAGTT